MSKLDAQRAMREANYARNKASGTSRGGSAPVRGASPAPTPAAAPAAPTPRAKPARAAAAAGAPPTTASADGARCGHKSMNGRACTREAAHSEKNHRYS